MKQIDNSYFELNGVKERIIKAPKSRKDTVTITMGGFIDQATEIALEDFESMTSLYFPGLEPEGSSFSQDEQLKRAKDALEKSDFTILEPDQYRIFHAGVDFTNHKDVKFGVYLSISKKDDTYTATVRKAQGWHSNGTKQYKGKNLELVINSALEQAQKFTSTKVQVIKPDTVLNPEDREFDSDGIPCLLPGETLEQFFKSQDMPAGAVINAKGRYQVFTSYMGINGMSLYSSKIKDYANLRNASKYLKGEGYDVFGKQLDSLDIKELSEFISDYLSRNHSASYSDDMLGDVGLDKGFATFSSIAKRLDEKFGVEYYIDVKYTDSSTGKSVSSEVIIDPREGGNTHSIATDLMNFAYEKSKEHIADTIKFDPDERTIEEKVHFHESAINSSKRMVEHYGSMVEKYADDERFVKQSQKNLEFHQENIKYHSRMIESIVPSSEHDESFSM